MLSDEEIELRKSMSERIGHFLWSLIDRDYESAARKSHGDVLCTEDELRTAFEGLGVRLSEPPYWEYSHIPLTEVEGTMPYGPFYETVMPLWSKKGRIGVGLHLRTYPFIRESQGPVPYPVPTGYQPGPTNHVELLGLVDVEIDIPEGGLPELLLGDPTPDPVDEDIPVSDRPAPERWHDVLDRLVVRLVFKDYAGLIADGQTIGWDDPDDFGRQIDTYPHDLVYLPDNAFDYSWVHPLEPEPGAHDVYVDLWDTSGHSDLTMEATVYDDGTTITAKIRSVHVT